jgi:hypothetical protein
VIQRFSDLGGSTSDLILKLLLGACGCPIYHPREFQVIWRPHSSRPNCWHFRVSGGSYLIRVSAVGGGRLSIWTSYFRRGFPLP